MTTNDAPVSRAAVSFRAGSSNHVRAQSQPDCDDLDHVHALLRRADDAAAAVDGVAATLISLAPP